MGDPDIVRGGPRWVELTVRSKLNIFNNRMVKRKKRKWKALVYKDGLSHGGDWSFKMLLMCHWAFFSHRCPLMHIFIVPTKMSFILFLVAVVLDYCVQRFMCGPTSKTHGKTWQHWHYMLMVCLHCSSDLTLSTVSEPETAEASVYCQRMLKLVSVYK